MYWQFDKLILLCKTLPSKVIPSMTLSYVTGPAKMDQVGTYNISPYISNLLHGKDHNTVRIAGKFAEEVWQIDFFKHLAKEKKNY